MEGKELERVQGEVEDEVRNDDDVNIMDIDCVVPCHADREAAGIRCSAEVYDGGFSVLWNVEIRSSDQNYDDDDGALPSAPIGEVVGHKKLANLKSQKMVVVKRYLVSGLRILSAVKLHILNEMSESNQTSRMKLQILLMVNFHYRLLRWILMWNVL